MIVRKTDKDLYPFFTRGRIKDLGVFPLSFTCSNLPKKHLAVIITQKLQ